MELLKVIKKQSCAIDFSAKSKDECLKQISVIMVKSVLDISADNIYKALMIREKSGSTGFENGIAIPHAKIAGLNDFVVGIIISKKGIDFASVDKKKSHIFFVIIGPDDKPREHLQILAQISLFSRNRNAQKELLNAENNEMLVESFFRFTSGSIQTTEKTKEKQKLFLMVLNELRFFDNIMEIFIGKGIVGVNILDSSGAENQLSDIPLFADFLNFLGEKSNSRKTILALLSESQIKDITISIEEMMGDLDKHSGAMIMALDVSFFKGTLES